MEPIENLESARDQLTKHFKEGGAAAPTPPGAGRVQKISELAHRFGLPDEHHEDAIRQVSEAARALDDWLGLAQRDQRRLMAYAAARARALQDAHPDFPDTIFHRLTQWSAAHRPGAVQGLSRDHRPAKKTWARDAQAAWEALGLHRPAKTKKQPSYTEQDLIRALAEDSLKDAALRAIVLEVQGHLSETRLVNLLRGQADRLRGDPKLKKLRKQIRRLEQQRPAIAPSPSPTPWPHRSQTEGKQVLMVGGDERVPARLRIEEAFGFSLTWHTGWSTRRCQAQADRIRARRYDLVLIVQDFLQHKSSDSIIPACKAAQVPFGKVHSGYGVEQVRRAVVTALGIDE